MSTMKMVWVGIPFEEGPVWLLGNQIGALKEQGVDRGEAVSAIVSGFPEEGDTARAVGEVVVRMREKRRSG